MDTQSGGLQHASSRALLKRIVEGLVDAFLEAGKTRLQIPIVFDNDWRCSYPYIDASAQVHLSISQQGIVDLQPWSHYLAANQFKVSSPQRKWHRQVTRDHGNSLPLVDFMLAATKPMALLLGLKAQVVWWLGTCLERLALSVMTTSPDDGRADRMVVGGSSDSFKDAATNYREIDVQLVRHMESTKLAVGMSQFVSLACDKADVHGLSLSNGVIVLPDNRASVMPPQVAWNQWKGVGVVRATWSNAPPSLRLSRGA